MRKPLDTEHLETVSKVEHQYGLTGTVFF